MGIFKFILSLLTFFGIRQAVVDKPKSEPISNSLTSYFENHDRLESEVIINPTTGLDMTDGISGLDSGGFLFGENPRDDYLNEYSDNPNRQEDLFSPTIDTHHVHHDSSQSAEIIINPATGLEMIDGIDGLDIGGNAYGQSTIDDYTGFNDILNQEESFDPFHDDQNLFNDDFDNSWSDK